MIKATRIGKFNVQIDTVTHCGDFTNGNGIEGELKFYGKALSEYDGVRFLPPEVIDGIRALGFIVSDVYE
jgi:hypothetical protein